MSCLILQFAWGESNQTEANRPVMLLQLCAEQCKEQRRSFAVSLLTQAAENATVLCDSRSLTVGTATLTVVPH